MTKRVQPLLVDGFKPPNAVESRRTTAIEAIAAK